ncbi:cleavage and polyadenylation specificity factor subunit 7-like isoform X2 [Corticium candelabrum]|uniref:cleavage and polyadenylation specificity factor subunit 7-like isoform X2 n=1 Tax=Corticium candelabrum TaxID=121492 RepID=UPI002E26A6A9|nr:cleavage and polyadenylation specificity factor subunit 7-like isoform X2 [Corticium candelabrum]
MADVDLYGDITTPTSEDANKELDIYNDLSGKPSSKQQYGGESPGKEADVSRDSTPSPPLEGLETGQSTTQQNDIPSLANRPVSPAKQEADLSTPKGVTVQYNNSPEPSKKSIYIGNLPWWTSDMQLANALYNLGAKDLKAIKFYENRVNGQSKGYALVEFLSEVSCHVVVNKLPKLTILGQQPIAALSTKVMLSQFEQMSKRGQHSYTRFSDKQPSRGRGNMRSSDEPRGARPPGPFRPGGMGPMDMPPGPPMGMFPPPMGGPPVPPGPWMGPMPPPGDMGMMMHRPMPGYDPMGMRPAFGPPPEMMMGPHARPPGAHINPNFIHPDYRPRLNESFGQGIGGSGAGHGNNPYGGVSGAEFAEVMKRNHAVSSTAMMRAIQDANTGDFDSAVNTLKTAMSLILQSSAANSESSQALIQSLKDCLQGIEEQMEHSRNAGHSSGNAGVSSPGRSNSSRSSQSRSPTPPRSRTPSPINDRSPARGPYDAYERTYSDKDKRDRTRGGRREREPVYSRHGSSRSGGTTRRGMYDDDRRSRRR